MLRTRSLASFAAAFGLVLVPAVAEAQWSFSVGGAASVPVGELSDRGLSKNMGWHVPLHEFPTEARTGVHVQTSLGYQFSRLPIGVRVDLIYQDFEAVEREPGVNVSLGGEWYRQLGGLFNLTYHIDAGRVRPYALAGIGRLREWHGDRTYYPLVQWTTPLHVGAGIEVPVLGFAPFLEVKYMNPTKAGRDMVFQSVPVTLGIRI